MRRRQLGRGSAGATVDGEGRRKTFRDAQRPYRWGRWLPWALACGAWVFASATFAAEAPEAASKAGEIRPAVAAPSATRQLPTLASRTAKDLPASALAQQKAESPELRPSGGSVRPGAPAGSAAAKESADKAAARARRAAQSFPKCTPLPAAGEAPWQPGERLAYDIDVMGAHAGKLALHAFPPLGSGNSLEHPLQALAASNSFFSKIRHVRGRSSSYVRGRDMHPRRYSEETSEGGVQRSAEVVFQRRDQGGGTVTVDWVRNERKGKERFSFGANAFDSLSAAYYLRSMPLEAGQSLCFDVYAIRKLWRVTGTVKGIETVRVPAGVFQAYHLEGKAVRMDKPSAERELHIWISADEKRLPLAALGVMDLGPVRAQLARIGGAVDEALEETVRSDLPARSGARPVLRR